MPKKKSDNNNLTPKSQMIRVPTALIPAVRELSHLHRSGHTAAVLQGLQDLISIIDSNSDIDIAADSKLVLQLEKRVEKLESRLATRSDLETKLEAVTQRLEQLERALAYGRLGNNTPTRRQSFPYQQQFVEVQPFPPQNLAQRLGVTPSTLSAELEKLTTKEFISWTRNRDPRSIGWEYRQDDGLYHPIK
ncbi:hypothetical protein [Scytonema sp. PRP1]|uniref:hypothetical protein n=1 Tax=Scytonema sp. PRP1 TaxID=3120513 RepID=UPI00300CA108